MHPLSAHQDACLKHCIIRGAISVELRTLATEGAQISETALLKLLHTFLVQCPLLVKHPETLSELSRLAKHHPMLAGLSKKAMGANNGPVASMLASVLSAGFLTPAERTAEAQADAACSVHDDASAEIGDGAADGDIPAVADKLAHEAAIDADVRAVMRDLATGDGAKRLAEVLATALAWHELPPPYRRLVKAGVASVLAKLETEMSDAKKAAHARTFYDWCPRNVIYAILRKANPMSRMSSLASLFLARPLGVENGVQRIMRSFIGYESTRLKAEELSASVDPRHRQQIRAWIDQIYDANANTDDDTWSESSVSSDEDTSDDADSREVENASVPGPCVDAELTTEDAALVRNVLLWRPPNATDTTTGWSRFVTFSGWFSEDEPLSVDEVDALSPAGMDTLHRLIKLEMRLKDKNKFISILGDQDMIALVHTLVSILSGPLAEMYAHADMASIIQALFEFMKACADLRNTEMDAKALRDGLRDAAETMAQSFYDFTRNILVKDEHGTVKDLIDWGLQFRTEVATFSLDLPDFMATLTGDECQCVLREVDETLAFWKRRQEKPEEKSAQPGTPSVDRLFASRFLSEAHQAIARLGSSGPNNGVDHDR
jgi:hypothetical protein